MSNQLLVITIYTVAVCAALTVLHFIRPSVNILEKVYKYRYWLAIYFFVITVVLELHGSSIGMWADYLPEGEGNSILWGTARPIRTDEWAVNTPFAFSQYAGKQPFSYTSDVVRGTQTDMFIVYGQPVWDIGLLFRPFHWGYLFLMPGMGLSFFWSGRFIALFMVSFEMGMLIATNKKHLALAYAFLISFAPVVQWWFAINGLVEMLVCGQIIVLLLKKYMNTPNIKLRCGFAALIGWLGVVYILVFYPSWQIPLFYVFVFMGIWILISQYKRGVLSRKDWISLMLLMIIVLGGIGYVYSKSAPTIESVANTVYPGSRSVQSGGAINRLFQSLGNIWLPFNADVPNANQCEVASVFDVFPLGIIMACIVLFKLKDKDTGLMLLLAVNAALFIWCVFPLPEILAKITFMSRSQPNRALMAWGLTNVLLLIRAMALYQGGVKIRIALPVAIILAGLTTAIAVEYYAGYITILLALLSVVLVGAFVLAAFYINKNNVRNAFLVGVVMIMLLMGGTVNPVSQGADVLLNNSLTKTIAARNQKEEGLWIVEYWHFPLRNLPIVVGAPTINSTNVYPNLDRWRLLDPTGQYEEIYNRYAHIDIRVQNVMETSFELHYEDAIAVNLNVNDMFKLNVKYILTQQDLTPLSNDTVRFILMDTVEDFRIYQVNY